MDIKNIDGSDFTNLSFLSENGIEIRSQGKFEIL